MQSKVLWLGFGPCICKRQSAPTQSPALRCLDSQFFPRLLAPVSFSPGTLQFGVRCPEHFVESTTRKGTVQDARSHTPGQTQAKNPDHMIVSYLFMRIAFCLP